MTVYTHDPFGGMRNPAPYGGGIAGGLMNRPPPFMPQQPMPQMPRRMPGGPSKGGTTSIPMPRPPMQRPGGPGKGRTRGGLMRRGRGRPMPGGPGKGRGRMQQPMPQINFGQGSMPMPTPRTQGPSSISSSPLMIQQGLGETGQFGNNPPQLPVTRPGGSGFSGPAVPDFGQRRTQGPMNMPPMNFPQPTFRPDQTMGRPMPQPSGFDRGSQFMPPPSIQFQQAGNSTPAPEFMGEVGQAFTQGPTSIPNSPFMRQQMGMRFYGGGITDLY